MSMSWPAQYLSSRQSVRLCLSDFPTIILKIDKEKFFSIFFLKIAFMKIIVVVSLCVWFEVLFRVCLCLNTFVSDQHVFSVKFSGWPLLPHIFLKIRHLWLLHVVLPSSHLKNFQIREKKILQLSFWEQTIKLRLRSTSIKFFRIEYFTDLAFKFMVASIVRQRHLLCSIHLYFVMFAAISSQIE